MLIENGGAAISEYMLNDSYSKSSFFWRNRLQSGLANVVFPIQGRLRSGTTHTVDFALVQKKKVIGVYFNEIEQIPQNEMFSHLKANNCPVIDISTNMERINSIILGNHKIEVTPSQMELFGNNEPREALIQEPGAKRKRVGLNIEKIVVLIKRLFK
jgi:predicted Rossmann fold nucleotide-binding protein DprA/Smf involved in DNA uptake